jgi:bacterioferritin
MKRRQSTQIAVVAPLPYPSIKVGGVAPGTAQMLTVPFANSKSEMSATCDYLYQKWILTNSNHSRHIEIGSTIGRIAQVEMHHLDILGTLITMLGGTPKYQCIDKSGVKFWNGSMVGTSRDLVQILQSNIKDETLARDAYLSLAEEICDPYIPDILRRLAQDETLHIQIFTNYLNTL